MLTIVILTKLLALISLNLQHAYSEYFYRNLRHTGIPPGVYKCWLIGKYYDKHYSACVDHTDFPVTVHDIKTTDIYRYLEMSTICKQRWYNYHFGLMFCIKPSSPKFIDEIMNDASDLKEPNIFRQPGKYTDGKLFNDTLHYNYMECLKIGKVFDERRRICYFLDLKLTDDKEHTRLNRILSEKYVRANIWSNICHKMNMQYDKYLKMCINRSLNKLRINVRIPYSNGSIDDDHEKHLYCIINGLHYNFSASRKYCENYSDNKMKLMIYDRFKSIFHNAKEIICAKIGMLYNFELDVCLQPIMKQKKARMRTLPLIDPTLEDVVRTEDEYGPNLRLFISARERQCFNSGFLYNKLSDSCDSYYDDIKDNYLMLAYRTNVLAFINQMLREHCFNHNLDYSKKLRICISRDRTKSGKETLEYDKELIRRKNYQRYQLYQLRLCIQSGLDYDSIREECVLYPRIISRLDFYKAYAKEQMIIACIARKRSYKEKLNFCPVKKDQNISDIDRIRFVKAYCHSKNMTFNELIKVCVSRKNKLKVEPEEMFEKYCQRKNRQYNKETDSCEEPSRYYRNIIWQEQIKQACRMLKLDYMESLQLCVFPRDANEMLTPDVPKLYYMKSTVDMKCECLLAGMMLTNSLDTECTHFPDRMSTKSMARFKNILKPYVDLIYSKFCDEANLTFNPTLRFCINSTVNDNYREPITIKTNVYEEDEQFCFRKGMRTDRVHDQKGTAYCASFNKQMQTENMQKIYNYYRERYISERCPPYTYYEQHIGYCIRFPLKRYDTLSKTPRIFRKLANLFKTQNQRNRDIHARMFYCIKKGLDYNEEENVCMNYRVKPTNAELTNYRRKLSELRFDISKYVCETLHKQFDTEQSLCA